MGTWPEYLKNSFGLRIFIGVCLLLTLNIVISSMVERHRLEGGASEDDYKVKSINIVKRLWIGMLAGYVTVVIVAVAQFIVRFGYFTAFQEIGAAILGLVGAVIGGLCGIMNWGRKRA